MGNNLALLTRLLNFRAQDIPVSVPKYLAQLTANTSGCFVLLFCDCCWVFVCVFVCFSRRGLCGYPGTYFTEPAGLKLKDLPTSVS